MQIGRIGLALALTIATFTLGCKPAVGDKAGGKKKFYWIQALKGHPVHQLTQIAFRDGCDQLGYACQIVGTDAGDTVGTVAMAEQVLARGDAAGFAIWTGNPAFNPFIEEVGKKGIPIILPHFPTEEGSVPGATGVISCDPAAYAVAAADAIGEQVGGKGTVIITQGGFNITENLVAEKFTARLHETYPDIKVLEPVEESFDTIKAVAAAVSILQAHPEAVAALSTTGGGPTTWATAQRDANRKLTIIGMDYTRVNLDLIKDGEVYAIVAQPLWEESFGAAELLDKSIKGEKFPWWTKLEAPIVTKDKLGPYYELLDKVEKVIGR